jgi:hypothetical protein
MILECTIARTASGEIDVPVKVDTRFHGLKPVGLVRDVIAAQSAWP